MEMVGLGGFHLSRGIGCDLTDAGALRPIAHRKAM
jgi:hypothetical protein